MEPETSTKHSSESSDIPDLNLPDAPDFISRPPLVSMEEMMRLTAQLRAWFPEGIKTPEERWAAKTDVPFRME